MKMTETVPTGDGIESMIVSTEWTDRDNDVVVLARLCEEMGLESKTELG